MDVDPAVLRRSYERGALHEGDLAADPFTQFAAWLAVAVEAGVLEPNAMTLATADATGRPSARTVLLKGVDERGFAFYTNHGSRKGRELLANPRAALVFAWLPLERQVTVTGDVVQVPREEAAAYFASRPRGSRVGAWASRQSEPVAREALDERYAELDATLGDDIALPGFWGGFRVVPLTVEFWQGRPSRLHDRLRFVREDVTAPWRTERLSP
ncbi:pyridoxamine 5'-phosphate oxidase [Motilibacter rhizosphaerae]|uniref:Pyridoxine/pyridoxamine 5'-phosphate oxidase n=1 Tax=Motilibacter rhizosphaerae TaxID=598652 RepID=A0A4Q7NQB8_9ACTN|nr:pyridoxamine 5'-phosphate oxidase [Motilibacter rhizosphaerae]RZS87489.1 pyridoxamine 5'-phosphate oxidase [Motilibacter rhizosphaerae]